MSGYQFILTGAPVICKSKHQIIVAKYYFEAEYVAAFSDAQEDLWLGRLRSDISMTSAPETVAIFLYNRGEIATAQREAIIQLKLRSMLNSTPFET